MKNKLFIFFVAVVMMNTALAQSTGNLLVNTTTKETGGNYAPKNILAIWVENGNGNFVKTLVAYANTRKKYLDTWEASTNIAGSVYNTVDAVTGATRTSHGTISCSWDGFDYKGNEVEDGTYNLRFELTDKNSTGNVASFGFSKSGVYQEQTPADVPSFVSTSIKWEPASIMGLEVKVKQNEMQITFNSSSGQLSVLGVTVKKLEIYNYAGQLVLSSSTSDANLANLHEGIYIVVVKSDTKMYSKKIVKF